MTVRSIAILVGCAALAVAAGLVLPPGAYLALVAVLVLIAGGIVALVWQQFLADVAGVRVPLAAGAVLGLVVWGVYLGDRWLDARHGSYTTDRHRFAARHSFAVALATALALAAAAIISLRLPDDYLDIGGITAAAVAGYFAGAEVVELRVSRAGLDALVRFIDAAHARGGETRATRLGPGLYGDSAFYPAEGRYSLLNTCNTWTAAALRAAGCPADPARTVTASGVMQQVRGMRCGAL